jgi:hypothetical protein
MKRPDLVVGLFETCSSSGGYCVAEGTGVTGSTFPENTADNSTGVTARPGSQFGGYRLPTANPSDRAPPVVGVSVRMR